MRSQVPEALVGVAFSVHLVFGHGVGAPLNRQSHEGRYEEHGSYNVKTRRADFPFYYSEAQARIVEWGIAVFDTNGVLTPKRK